MLIKSVRVEVLFRELDEQYNLNIMQEKDIKLNKILGIDMTGINCEIMKVLCSKMAVHKCKDCILDKMKEKVIAKGSK